MIAPHGGSLVDRILRSARSDQVRDELRKGPTISFSPSQFKDAVNIATGRFSPLTGFLGRNDFQKVVNDMTLEDGTIWSLPIVLDIDVHTAESVSPGQRIGLESPDGSLVGYMDVEDLYKFNKHQTANAVFGTTDEDHPGVAAHLAMDDYLLGGNISLFDEFRHNGHDLRPAESRVLFENLGWETVVGFQTRNAPHRAHEYIQKTVLEEVHGLLIQPKLGDKKEGDYRDEVILTAYEELIERYYPDDRVALSVFPSRMRYAGPREALFDAIVRKNQGCTHFVIGHDHAGVKDYYDGYAAQDLFDFVGDIGIQPRYFAKAFYCKQCDGMCSEKTCPHDDDERQLPRGQKIRRLIRDGSSPSSKIMRPEVTETILDADNPFIDETSVQEVHR